MPHQSPHNALQDVSPATYIVGRRRTNPLVQTRQLKGHLALLHAFDALRRDVEFGDLSRFPQDVHVMDPEIRWAWFVGLAVERFERWCTSIRDARTHTIEETLPPIDVVMVWHTYLLNPIWYAEDTLRISMLSSLSRYTKYLTTHLESPEILLLDLPDPDRMQFWRERTMTPYDPFVSARELTNIVLRCPHCESLMEVPILASNGRGYAQSKFLAHCSSCQGQITKELLGLYKFSKDIVKEKGDGLEEFLAGTLHSRDNMQDSNRASLIKKRVRSRIGAYTSRSSTQRRPVVASDIMRGWDHDPTKLTKELKNVLLPGIANRIVHAYSDDRPFSIELIGAVLRQGSFVRKMAELGWTQPSFFSDHDGEIILGHCVTRYHAFLNLIAGSPGSFFVPTLDIDLAWHTHQLMADQYQKDCKTLAGRYVDHDDKVEEGHLATSFDLTCRAWTDRYDVPYTHCGCPQPGTTIGQRLRHAFRKNERPDTTLLPPDTATLGTHPSEHNAVFSMHDRQSSMGARERRRQKSERRRLRETREAAKRGTANIGGRQTHDRAHPDPFLYPVPLYYAPVGGCVAGIGGVVDGGVPFAGAQCASGVCGRCSFGTASCGGPACGGGGGGCSSGGGGGGSGCGGGGGGCGGGSGGGGGCGGGGGGGGGCGGGGC